MKMRIYHKTISLIWEVSKKFLKFAIHKYKLQYWLREIYVLETFMKSTLKQKSLFLTIVVKTLKKVSGNETEIYIITRLRFFTHLCEIE